MSDHDDPSPPPTAPGAVDADAELAAVREEARQNHDRWLRERADLENLKKRFARERQDAIRFGNESLLRDLLPVLDNLERALAAAGEGGEAQRVAEGLELVRKAFVDTLQRHGVERITAAGEPFDPSRHEAVAYVESDTHEAHQVMVEHQPGYRLNERLLRPAMVTVSKGKATPNLANRGGGDYPTSQGES